MATLGIIWAWMCANKIAVVGILYGLFSDILGSIPAIKANAVYQFLFDIVKWLKGLIIK